MENFEENPKNSLDKRLFSITIEIVEYILAEDEDDAEEIFEDYKHEILDNSYNRDTNIHPLKHLPYGIGENEEPYGSDGRTIKEIWKQMEAEREKIKFEAKHKTLFPEVDCELQKRAKG